MDNFQIIVRETCASGDAIKFWQTSTILLHNPHTINRRIAVSTQLLLCELEQPLEELLILLRAMFLSPTEDIVERLTSLFHFRNIDVPISELRDDKIYLRFASLLPRNEKNFAATLEIAVIDRAKNRLTYCYKKLQEDKKSLGNDFFWSLGWNDNSELSLSVEKGAEYTDWLAKQLYPKFVKWMTNDAPNSFQSGSLNLVDSERYIAKYAELKEKYGQEMVKIWPESTDPLKFVYEDVAIATYLLLLWEDERRLNHKKELQSFVDLGCGNGLLVHFLTSEGHPGFGIDLRARKIWNMYPSSTKLEVRTIVPSSANLFPDIDWLIGNHSDELSPWIPVIAARSSYNCRFFLLPCCAYEFDGTKYQRNDSSLSQYHEYLNYVQSISESCGFRTQVDKLRIPSTKRICFLGCGRTYPQENYADQEIKIQETIHKRSSGEITEPWDPNFKPREAEEKVRNCTKVDRDLVSNIINVIVKGLLEKCHVINVNGREWNSGGTMEIKDAVSLLEVDQLKQLKKECGGLQTLLKNNGHIFRVAEGKIRLRNPSESGPINEKRKRRRIEVFKKIKPCWFHENHPDGCPHLEEVCTFRHDT